MTSAAAFSVLDLAPVIPVVVLDDAADAVPLARALVAGGLTAIEITLRTPAALGRGAGRRAGGAGRGGRRRDRAGRGTGGARPPTRGRGSW